MWLLYIFLISFFGILILLTAKIKEIRNKQQTSVGKFLAKGDPYILTFRVWFKSFFSHHQERAFFLFLVHIPDRIEMIFKNLKARTNDYYHRINARLRNRRDLSNDGVSPYIRSILFRRDGDNRRY